MGTTEIIPPTGKKWAEFTFHYDDAPLDISFMFENEKPAGKHGFLQKKGSEFVFEDGAAGRFWGTLVNSAACFPSHESAEKTARRLAKFGINIVRLHQFDAEWATPNIFQYTKGKEISDTLNFDPESMDRFDYFVHCLKEHGIYIYMDLLIYRTFKEGDGVDNADELRPNGAKPYSLFDRKLIELQKKYNYDLLTHINPYTKLAYKDDPAMSMVLITNENDMFNGQFPVDIEPYRSNLEKMYREWAARNKVELPEGNISFDFRTDLPSENILRFYHEVQCTYLREMYDHLLEIGVKVPIAGDSWSKGLCLVSSLKDMDFTCSNVYWALWRDSGHNVPLVGERRNVFGMVPAKIRTSHQPLFVTEWDMTWPHEWRSMSTLMMASMAVLQGWSGVTLHTYRYTSLPTDCMGGTVLGGIGYRQNFETSMDPAKFGLFYAASILYRRGDVTAAQKTLNIALTEKDIFNPEHGMSHHNKPNIDGMINCEKHRVEITLPDTERGDCEAIGPDELGPAAKDENEVLSDTGELFRSWKDKYGWINTPLSKIVYGFFNHETPIELDGLSFDVKTDFATIAFTSLTDKPISESSHILLTAVGRADNTGASYNEDHTKRLSIGHGPVLYEVIEADFELKTPYSHLNIWSIDRNGGYTGKLVSEYSEGKLKFTIGGNYPSIYYLITR